MTGMDATLAKIVFGLSASKPVFWLRSLVAVMTWARKFQLTVAPLAPLVSVASTRPPEPGSPAVSLCEPPA